LNTNPFVFFLSLSSSEYVGGEVILSSMGYMHKCAMCNGWIFFQNLKISRVLAPRITKNPTEMTKAHSFFTSYCLKFLISIQNETYLCQR
jgi:hypothetical protein